jgi:tetratricopeptide (TPR) repeat protein
MDDEALIRRTAVESLNESDIRRKTELIAPFLYDPVKAVRIQAASTLAGEPSKHLDANQEKVFRNALKEFVASMEYSGDFAFGRYNLGNLYAAQGRTDDAIQNYRAAVKIDGLFYPAKVNLAMLYNQLGKNDKAEGLLREVVADHPGLYEPAYSLGLLLAEKKQWEEAAFYLQKAAKGMPEHTRVHYNLGVLLDYLQKDNEAERALQKALVLEPANIDYLSAAAEFYMKRKRFDEAKKIAEQMISKHPNSRMGQQILDIINRNKKP